MNIDGVRCIDCKRLKEPDSVYVNNFIGINTVKAEKLYKCNSILVEAYIPESSIDKRYKCKFFKEKEK